MEMNVIMVIYPYKYRGQWVFDDTDTGLVKEPFVAGADVIIDMALKKKEVRKGEEGFRLTFSAIKFPGYDLELDRVREEAGGWWYYSPELEKEGWLCPALFKYFESAPRKIYAKFEEEGR
jgi:hypothetical protein